MKLVLEALTERMMAWLEEGHGVRFGKLGSFLPSVRSKSGESADDAEVKRIRIAFYPSRELSKKVAGISINTVSDEKPSAGSTEGGSGGGNGDDNTNFD